MAHRKKKKVTSEWCYHKNEKSACCLSARLSFIHLEKHTWCHKKNKSLNLSADSFILLRKPQWVSEWGRKNKYFIAHFACSFPFTLIIQVSVWRFFFDRVMCEKWSNVIKILHERCVKYWWWGIRKLMHKNDLSRATLSQARCWMEH